MKVSLIAAMTPDRVIGKEGGGVPWHLPRDVAHFRSYTTGKHLLVGRRTYEEMRGWFQPGHSVYVLSSRLTEIAEGVTVVHGVREAILQAMLAGAEELVVIGGGHVYAAAFPFADQLLLTVVGVNILGGVLFPSFEIDDWEIIERSSHPADWENKHPLCFQTLRRIR